MATITKQDSNAQARVYFKTPPGTEDSEVVQKQGRVTVKYDRKELRKRLNLEEWIIDQLTDLYDCEVCSHVFSFLLQFTSNTNILYYRLPTGNK